MNPFTLVKLHGIETGKTVWFRGVAIKERSKPYRKGFNTKINNFWSVTRSYFIDPVSNKEINLLTGENSIRVKTDKKGNFDLQLSSKDAKGLSNIIDLDYPILFKDKKSDFIIISDIDDTILRSHIKDPFMRMWRLLFTTGPKRKTIASTEEAFRFLGEDGIRWFYVSRSESNLFPIISSFILEHKLPVGPIFLRSFTNGMELLKSGREKEFKELWIQWIADKIEEPQMIFFGDDSQHDLNVFTDFAKMNPGRVRAIFIRKTGYKNKNLGEVDIVPTTYFYEHYSDIKEILNSIKDEITFRS